MFKKIQIFFRRFLAISEKLVFFALFCSTLGVPLSFEKIWVDICNLREILLQKNWYRLTKASNHVVYQGPFPRFRQKIPPQTVTSDWVNYASGMWLIGHSFSSQAPGLAHTFIGTDFSEGNFSRG